MIRTAAVGLVRAPAAALGLTAVRTATKKVSGSKTNKNDSAGRRLGPKVHEGHFVKPGQILMRQRGTKLHPGENTDIGKDHTIYAREPGYVRFYYDPFHPLRKYVGIALKRELTLPTPHFEPRVRRFGWVPLADEAAAQEEARMSRKEYLQQEAIGKTAAKRAARAELTAERLADQLQQFELGVDEPLAVQRLTYVSQLVSSGLSEKEAQTEATFRYEYDQSLRVRRGEASADEAHAAAAAYRQLATQVDGAVRVDGHRLRSYMDEATQTAQRAAIATKLEQLAAGPVSKDAKSQIEELIGAEVFTSAEKRRLRRQYVPHYIETPAGGKSKAKTVRRYDAAAKTVSTVARAAI